MIDNTNRRVRINDRLYFIYWTPIDDKPTWIIKEYTIKDMYYSNNCYVLLEDEQGNIKELLMEYKNLLYWFDNKEDAEYQRKKEQDYPRNYAWGNFNKESEEYEKNI